MPSVKADRRLRFSLGMLFIGIAFIPLVFGIWSRWLDGIVQEERAVDRLLGYHATINKQDTYADFKSKDENLELGVFQVGGWRRWLAGNHRLVKLSDISISGTVFDANSGESKEIPLEPVLEDLCFCGSNVEIIEISSDVSDQQIARLAACCPALQCLKTNGKKGDLTDKSLEVLSKMAKLDSLRISSISLTDAGVVKLAKLPLLETLEISGSITGATIPSLRNLRRLDVLGFLCPEFFRDLHHCEQLEELTFSPWQLTDSEAVGIGRLPRLHKIRLNGSVLYGSPLTDSTFAAICANHSITSLALSDITGLTYRSLEVVASLPLESLDIQEVPLDDAGIDALCRMKNLKTLRLSEIEISKEALLKLLAALPTTNISGLGVKEVELHQLQQLLLKSADH